MEMIQKDAATAASLVLATSSVTDLRHIRVDGSDNKIELTGTVRSFYHKQLAQESIRSVAGGMQVVNHVERLPR